MLNKDLLALTIELLDDPLTFYTVALSSGITLNLCAVDMEGAKRRFSECVDVGHISDRPRIQKTYFQLPNGHWHGPCKWTLLDEIRYIFYRDNLKHGVQSTVGSPTRYNTKHIYHRGVKNGPYSYWEFTDTCVERGTYKNGEQDGPCWWKYTSDGTFEECIYKDGLMMGNTLKRFSYKDGQKVYFV